MRSRYQSATTALTSARTQARELSLADQTAQQEVRVLTETLDDPNLNDAQRDVLSARAQHAAQRAAKTSADAQAAMGKFTSASNRWRTARADFDSTPQGLAALQQTIFAATRDGDHASLEAAHQRLGEATSRMTDESRERSQRWGSDAMQYFVPTADVQKMPDAAADVIAPDTSGPRSLAVPVTGAVQRSSDDQAVVTYTFHTDRDVKVRVPLPNPESSPPPVSGVVSQMAEGARDVRAPNFVQYCHLRDVDRKDPAQVAVARAQWDSGRQYDKQGAQVFGDSAWSVIRGD